MTQPPSPNGAAQSPDEDPEQPDLTDSPRSHRWKWIGAVLAALAVGFAVGAVSVPADEAAPAASENANVQQEGDETAGEDVALADDQQELDDRTADLDKRDKRLDKRKEKLDKRDKRLDGFEGKLDERKTKLDEREKAIDDAETDVDDEEDAGPVAEDGVAEGTIPGNGVYLVGQDVPAGSYTTSGSEDADMSCYYAFLDSVEAGAEILDNQLIDGQSRVSLTEGQVFETKRCADWQRE